MKQRQNQDHPSCRAKMHPGSLENFAVAMGYVPWQYLSTLYEPDKALKIGTIFPELNKPFDGIPLPYLGTFPDTRALYLRSVQKGLSVLPSFLLYGQSP